MDNNDLMNQFNDDFENKVEPVVEPYRATQNQSLDSNVNNLNNMNNNANNVVNTNFVNQNCEINMVPEVNNSSILIDVNSNNSGQQLYNTTAAINDVVVDNKKKKTTIKINPELKTVMLLALILLIAMSFIPVIFDWIDNLRLKM